MKHFIIFIILLFPVVVMAEETCQGLWSGQIELDQVTEISNNTVQPVKHAFDMTILLHVDKNNVVRLLRHVTMMQKTEMIDGNETVRRVLITDDSLLPEYDGIVRRDGKLTGIRLGTLAFGFSSDTDTTQTIMAGTMAEGQQISCTLFMDKNHPTNPFKHLYHPDHKQGKDITRRIELTFLNVPNNDPDDEKFALAGQYKEEITGLHKNKLSIAGSFKIQRVSDVDTLND
ncbi:MAG: hypothetical protein HQK75_12450 [Candidatus Magnetomorum sp.]|nr:hypothetical protein [Candidatus Magnetomorum sp.]